MTLFLTKLEKSYMKKSIVWFGVRCNTERRFHTARLQGERWQSIWGIEPKRAATAHLYVSVCSFFFWVVKFPYLLRLVPVAERLLGLLLSESHKFHVSLGGPRFGFGI